MRVYTFYNPCKSLGDATLLINLWRESWQKQGWQALVISEPDAASHPQYLEYCLTVDSFPTVNGREYESACFHRWLAMAQMADSLAVLSDYDVINRSFTPDDADKLMGTGNLLILEPTRVPCAVLGTPDGFQMLCAEIMRYRPTQKDYLPNGRIHVSDMVITRNSRIPFARACVEFGCSGESVPNHPGDGWKTAKLVHFSTHGFIRMGIPKTNKADMIKVELEKLNYVHPVA